MATKHYRTGELIFEEGESSSEAYFLVLGTVEISIRTPEGPLVLGRIGPGEIFGEMGMITDRPRSATARAVEHTTVESIDEGIFEQSILRYPDRLRTYLMTLFDRLRTTDTLLQRELAKRGHEEGAQAAANAVTARAKTRSADETPPSRRIVIRSDTNQPGHPGPTEIAALPFRIGRAYGDSGVAMFARNDLSIPDVTPYHISRNHCEIDEEGGQIVVRDRGSTLGTTVNGTALGIHHLSMEAPLKNGENILCLGDEHSRHRFVLTVG